MRWLLALLVCSGVLWTQGAEAQFSNTCYFLRGPRMLQKQSFPQVPPIPEGSPCYDGQGSYGVAVSADFESQAHFDLTPAGPVCRDIYGRNVPYLPNDNIPKSGLATMSPAGPVIYIRASQMPMLSLGVQMLLFAHECGHHGLGHIIMYTMGAPIQAPDEMNADCWGLRQWRQTTMWSRDLEEQALQFMMTLPADEANAPGPVRVATLRSQCQ